MCGGDSGSRFVNIAERSPVDVSKIPLPRFKLVRRESGACDCTSFLFPRLWVGEGIPLAGLLPLGFGCDLTVLTLWLKLLNEDVCRSDTRLTEGVHPCVLGSR